MNKVRFIGKSDEDFTNGKVYQLINIQLDDDFAIIWLVDDNNKINYIPYCTLRLLNENWEVINE